ncbi:hypothetical protein KDU71_00285 [Carboxylicivirga sediminis]|uniref:Mpv17/PMP22 family protein n=1 Tax=Carboxylicivirga sediminis TaxID=2006564 RepID=A0A941IWV8_9BACT|nr:hypothetical protein [Carboxylicivirga sediminis]MBR8533982.1 hypothetical protein [Carboxylicivirga sediminis]
MSRKLTIDIIFCMSLAVFFAPFFLSATVFGWYEGFNLNHPMFMSFLKFAVLATLGEVIGLRIKTGRYTADGFGILPRAIIWGLLGLTIKMAFVIFASGVPVFLEKIGVEGALAVMSQSFTAEKLLVAFCISAAMNLIYAPVMMTLHRITDTHIIMNNGSLTCLLKPVAFGKIMKEMDWGVQWNFVFKKTIPFFWIPAHTITFLMAPEYRVLFAALLGIVLGVLLAIAGNKKPSAG